ncbi:thiol peroxidase [Enterococcus sp.]|jgi:thioredoxin-dependent peroxiredoxin|uniref:thiol peroxidase n=1 Tax=Enterococcus sp. TaxID=35783 RepID=UPI0028B22B32|nr:thiol peroxidase [Enterococcus sp.]
MQVTRKGTVYEVPGDQPRVGDIAHDFRLKSLDDTEYTLASFLGKATIISVVPDIDTRVCALQTKRFNQEASQIDDIHFVTISNNTKEEQENWCGKEGVDMIVLHDPANTFGEAYHIMIPTFGHFARAIFVLDADGVIRHVEIVPEIAQEPDYNAAIEAAKANR